MNNGRIAIALAIGITGASAMNGASALYVESASDGETRRQHRSTNLMPREAVFVPDALSGSSIAGWDSSRNRVMRDRRSGADAYAVRHAGNIAANNNNGPDDYFPPKYRDGRCVEDEGNTLLAEPAVGAGVRRLEGRMLERALALQCRRATLWTGYPQWSTSAVPTATDERV
jgi:hypothetical protein